MLRLHVLGITLALLGFGASCKRSQLTPPVVIHVWRDSSASFADNLKRADLQFGSIGPELKNGKPVMVATNEGDSFAMLLKQFAESTPELLILESENDMPSDPDVRDQLREGTPVCGPHPAFIPSSVSGDRREAAQMYVEFLRSHCKSTH